MLQLIHAETPAGLSCLSPKATGVDTLLATSKSSYTTTHALRLIGPETTTGISCSPLESTNFDNLPGTSRSFNTAPRTSKLISAEANLDLLSLPLEVMERVCAQMRQHDLTKLARTCVITHDPAERRLWRHLNLIGSDLEDGARWFQIGRASKWSWAHIPMSQRAYKELILHLEERPHLALSVEKISICAGFGNCKKLSEVFNLASTSLREIDIVYSHYSTFDTGRLIYQPWLVGMAKIFNAIKPLPRVTKLTLTLSEVWTDEWKTVLAATPRLEQLVVNPLLQWAGGWDHEEEFNTLERFYQSYDDPIDPAPVLPELKFLHIEQMSRQLEEAIMDLLKTSKAPHIKLWLEDPAHIYQERGIEFEKLMKEWQESGRLSVEYGLPPHDAEEQRIHLEQAFDDWMTEQCGWDVPDLVGDFIEEEMEPITRQGKQKEGWLLGRRV
jgi:hypothetical protein